MTFTDANSCTGITIANLTPAAPVNIALISTPARCFGDSSILTWVLSGGLAPNSIKMENNANGATVFSPFIATPGTTYSLTATDFFGCFTDTIVTIPSYAPTAVLNLNTTVTDIICPAVTGSIDYIVSGGTSPLVVDTSGIVITSSPLSNLLAGIYTINVTDSLGCIVSKVDTVLDLGSVFTFTYGLSSPTSICVDSVYQIFGIGTPGMTFVLFDGTNTFTDTADFMITAPLLSVTFTITATDVSGCTLSTIVQLTPFGCPNSISGLTFTGFKTENRNVLEWKTVQEKNSKNFHLMKSIDVATGYKKIATIPTLAPNGNSASTLSYKFDDYLPALGHNYYKLLIEDQAGQTKESNIVDLYWSLDGSIVTVYPNPTSGNINVDLNIAKASQVTISVYDVTGKIIRRVEVLASKGLNTATIDLSAAATGVYMIKVTDGKGLNYANQFRKN